MKIVSVSVTRGKEFAVVGVADLAKKTATFQTTCNGVPYFESEDYEEAREVMMEGVRINTPSERAAN